MEEIKFEIDEVQEVKVLLSIFKNVLDVLD